MARINVVAADELIDKEIQVLDKGFVRLVDYMGGDARIVQSARVSYGAGTKTVREDSALIDYLLRNDHTSPFEQVILTFHIKTPIFIARQWIRHRTARINEISGRYSVMKDDFYIPVEADVKPQSNNNKQGRSEQELPAEVVQSVRQTLSSDQALLYKRYESYIETGVARELARINLPLSLYTEFYWQIDLHNLFHFLRLRLDSHAQKEIRDYAKVLASAAEAVAPLAYQAFERHIVKGRKISAEDVEQLLELIEKSGEPGMQKLKEKLEGK